jgi:MFS family permease
VGLLLAPLMTRGSLAAIWLFLSTALFVMGLLYGPLGAWMPSLFPARVRYTGISVAFTVGGILGGGIAPIVAQSLAIHGGLQWVGFYLSAAALVSLLALLTLGHEVSRNRIAKETFPER